MKDTGIIEIYGHLKIIDTVSGKVILDRKIDQPLKDIKHYDRCINTKNNRPRKDNK